MTDPGLVSVTAPSRHAAADELAAQAPAPADPAAMPSPAPAAVDSPLGLLRDRRQKLLQQLYTDIRVPRWGDDGGPSIYVRYGPAQPSVFQERIEKVQKQQNKPKDWMVRENAQVLVTSCIGVYAVEGDAPLEGEDTRTKFSLRDGDPSGAWTRFDPDLAESLGLPTNCGAIAVVTGLYFTESDITSTVARLLRWSGAVLPQDNQDFFGG